MPSEKVLEWAWSPALIFEKIYVFIFMYVNVLYMYICILHMYLVLIEARKKVSDSLELELWMVVNCHVDVRN